MYNLELPPQAMTIEEVHQAYETGIDGLSEEQVVKRLDQIGYNELPEPQGVSRLLLFFKQFRDPLVIILMVAAAISFFTQHLIDAYVIIFVILVNAIIGFAQEYRADKAIAALKKIIVKTAKVIRQGEQIMVHSRELVPGDIIVLEEGDSIPADARVIEAKNLRTIEASLTGESLPANKMAQPIPEATVLADQVNMVFKGTFLAGGYAKAVVTGTGLKTALGEISEALQGIVPEKTNFQKKTAVLARQMSVIAIASALLIFLVGYFIRGFDLDEMLLTSIAALVAAVPEGLPAVITIVLAMGASKMAKRKAIVREFSATETLGAVTAILTDKTGTLTQNSLTAKKVFIPEEEVIEITGEGWYPVGNFIQNEAIIEPQGLSPLKKLLEIAAISNNAKIVHKLDRDTYELMGDPTEGALVVLARKAGLRLEQYDVGRIDDLPFDSYLKLRATLYHHENTRELMVVGAPEKILDLSGQYVGHHGLTKITDNVKEEIKHKIELWSAAAMRVIAVAFRPTTAPTVNTEELDDLVFLGIVGMLDPPRPDAADAVAKCKRAGIKVMMVTGDHINTAVAIAKATGIVEEDPDTILALTEEQLANLDPEEFDRAISEVSVFARLTPKMKLKIAQRLQEMGHLIAMTGDGVNDAPALKKADVGISMGIMGTDVARDASKLVLADDNFATIVNAIEEGRTIFRNARQTSFFLVTTNLAESATLLISILIGLPVPLTATQILWLNLVTDGVSGVALATEPGHKEVLLEKPVSKKENILNKTVLPYLLINLVIMTTLSLLVYVYFLDQGLAKARTGVFVVLAFAQIFNIFNMRSLRKSVFSIGLFSNRFVNIAVLVSALLLIAVTEIPPLASIFHFQVLNYQEFLLLMGLSTAVFFVVELYKFIKVTWKK